MKTNPETTTNGGRWKWKITTEIRGSGGSEGENPRKRILLNLGMNVIFTGHEIQLPTNSETRFTIKPRKYIWMQDGSEKLLYCNMFKFNALYHFNGVLQSCNAKASIGKQRGKKYNTFNLFYGDIS